LIKPKPIILQKAQTVVANSVLEQIGSHYIDFSETDFY
jgi:hypothetical protein